MADLNPTELASQLATVYVTPTQTLLDTRNKQATAASAALTKLKSAMAAFDTAMKGLSSKTVGLLPYSAAFADAKYGTAQTSATAQPGSYPLFIERLATTDQVAFEDLPAVPAVPGGQLKVALGGGSNFTVNLDGADTDGDNTLSQSEIARAINQAAGNGGLVTAMVMTSGGQTQLMLSSGKSGEAGRISLDTSALPANALRSTLEDPAKRRQVVLGEDAVVWMGAQGTGVRIQQDSNLFTAIDGVKLTLKAAMNTGDAPAVLTVSQDSGGAAANVKAFIDAYNQLEKTLDDLTAPGSTTSGTSSAAFASDAGVRALRSRMSAALRQEFGGATLRTLGISVDRSGQLSVDNAKLTTALAAQPALLEQVLGSAASSNSKGLMGSLSSTLLLWTDITSGQIKQRQDSVAQQQKSITERQARLDRQYSQAFDRYLKQFTQLQQLQSSLGDTTSLLSSLGT
jgi:flagellar hook-associated protein 2